MVRRGLKIALCGLVMAYGSIAIVPAQQPKEAKRAQDSKDAKAAPAIDESSTDVKKADVAPSNVRPANRDLWDKAKKAMDKLERQYKSLKAASEKPAKKGNEALKDDLYAAYDAIHKIDQYCDELLLRGEIDGLYVRSARDAFRAQIDQLANKLRPQMVGSQEGLAKRRGAAVKTQANALAKFDKLMEDQNIEQAHAMLMRLVNDADEIGLISEPKDAGAIYGPVFERLTKHQPAFLAHQKTTYLTSLRKEYESVRPDLAEFRKRLADAVAGRKPNGRYSWSNSELIGPELMLKLGSEWNQLGQKTAQSLAVVHSMGTPAKEELAALAAEYSAARREILEQMEQMIAAEPQSLTEKEVEARYIGYLQNLPLVMSYLRASPADLQGTVAPLDRLAGRSQVLAATVERYRHATSDYLRWQKRLSRRYLAEVRRAFPIPPLAPLLTTPPPSLADKGAKAPVHTHYSFQVSAPQLGGYWAHHWRKAGFTVTGPVSLWLNESQPVVVSSWQQRVAVESPVAADVLNGYFQGLANELLAGPITIEAMLAAHTARYGPYVELGGIVADVGGDGLTDRLWDLQNPFDVPGALDPRSLAEFPDFPAHIRFILQPFWLAHEYFVWAVPHPPAPPPEPSSNAPRSETAPQAASDTKVTIRGSGKPAAVKKPDVVRPKGRD